MLKKKKDNTRTDEVLRKELNSLGAREYEIVALTMDPERGLAALQYAESKGVDHPIAYAIKVFDSDWEPRGVVRVATVTNAHVARSNCETCDGDRIVLIGLRPSKNPLSPYEDYATCPDCFTGDISHLRFDGSRFAPPAPEKVREMMWEVERALSGEGAH